MSSAQNLVPDALDLADTHRSGIHGRLCLDRSKFNRVECLQQGKPAISPMVITVENLAQGADHTGRKGARLVVRRLSDALKSRNQRVRTETLQALRNRTNSHRLPGALTLDGKRISKDFDFGPEADVGGVDGPSLACYDRCRMQGHWRDWHGNSVDCLKGSSLLLSRRNDHLAGNAIEPDERRRCGPMLSINDNELSSLDRRDNNGGETGPREGFRNSHDIPLALADNRPLVRWINQQIFNTQPLQHWNRASANIDWLFEPFR